MDASIFADGWVLMNAGSGIDIHSLRAAMENLAVDEYESMTAPERRKFREFATANCAIAKFRSCPPLRPASAVAAKPSWAVAARAAAASPGPRTKDAAQAQSAAMMPTGASCASTVSSATDGDALIVAGDLN